jgi:GNAT superfamily N-acetyltransferase
MMQTPIIRLAREDELDALRVMQRRSLLELGARCYPASALEAMVRAGTMDPSLIQDGTYLVAMLDGRIAGSAGWTTRTPSYARLMRDPPAPLPGRTGLVRSVFVDPDFARRGIARRLMQAVHQRMAREGAQVAELMATLSGVPLYAALGYVHLSDHALEFGGDVRLAVRRMARMLIPERLVA